MRNGFKNNFLGENFNLNLPEPSLRLVSDVLQPPGLEKGDLVVPYINYSLLMSKSTKQALYSAANTDLDKIHSGVSGRTWFYDDRIGRENQIQNYAYQGTNWDRGHLTRRTAVTWGDDIRHASNASNDSCSYANASIQHKNFNQDEWKAIEKYVSEFSLARKLSVFTGPIFTICDRYFTKKFEDYPVRIPSGFWKIVCYVNNNQLITEAFLFMQDDISLKTSDSGSNINLEGLQVTTTELEMWTGLEFEQVMYDTNRLKFYNGPERISTKEHRDLLNKNPNTVTLDEGVVSNESIIAAKKAMPLEKFYALIDKISWI